MYAVLQVQFRLAWSLQLNTNNTKTFNQNCVFSSCELGVGLDRSPLKCGRTAEFTKKLLILSTVEISRDVRTCSCW